MSGINYATTRISTLDIVNVIVWIREKNTIIILNIIIYIYENCKIKKYSVKCGGIFCGIKYHFISPCYKMKHKIKYTNPTM